MVACLDLLDLVFGRLVHHRQHARRRRRRPRLLGEPLRIGNIRKEEIHAIRFENTRQGGWFNTDRAVLLPVMKQSDANVISVVDEIHSLLPQVRKWLPPGVEISILSDRTQTIRASVHDVQFTLILTIALVIVVMALFLRRFWPTFIAGVTVPLALAGTFAVMWLCGSASITSR